jgi:tetratricopeptide (TPR) repeat protein
MNTPRFGTDTRNILIILAFISAVYFNALSNGFVWVDQYQIVDKGLIIENSRGLIKAFTTNIDYQFKFDDKGDYYRPLVNMSFSADYFFWKLNAFGYHLTSILLHLLSTLLLYKIFVFLLKDKLSALLGSLLFAVHPVLPASVTWISGRADPLCALFFLSSFYLYIKAGDKTPKSRGDSLYWAALVFFLFALLSKEMAITLPVIISVYWYFFERFASEPKTGSVKSQRARLFYIALFYAVAVFYIVMRARITHGVGAGLPLFRGNFYPTALSMAKVICDYLGLLVLPLTLTISDAARVYTSISHPQVILSLVSIALLLAVAVLDRKKYKEAAFAILWFFIALFPISNIIPAKHFRAERFLYIPYIGLFLLLAAGLNYLLKIERYRRSVAACGLLLIFVFSCRTIWRNMDFKDDATLFTRTIRTSPYCNEAHLVFANLNLKENNLSLAIREYQIALDPNPGYFTYKSYYEAHNNLGLALARSGRLDRAIDEFKEAHKVCPDCTEAWENLKVALSKKEGIKGEISR